eukprot:TRINITY_DN5870_c0_g1_i1.p1 TRINITY_DN5870_c0_g1~~TRINITY_DN5870_c0_g1_i1.p1  ORF type:complete len:557 (-),score=143.26 TRINITY_DN5870_c0_g1_i1:159-1727(-)
MSESSKKGQASSEEYFPRRFSSQESDVKVEKQDPAFQDVSDSLLKLSLSKKRGKARLSKQRYVSESSSEDEEHRRMRKETHSKIRSKLKLKNRKKSKATPQFLNQIKDSKDYDSANEGRPSMNKLVQISTNLTVLVDTQLVRMDLIDNLYKERFKEDLRSNLLDNDINKFISEYCKDLTTVNVNMVPHVVLRKGEFVQNYLKRVNDVLYNLLKRNDYSPVPVHVIENEYKEVHGSEAFLDLDFVTKECVGMRKTSHAFGREFFEITSLYMLGNEIVEMLIQRGGILPLENVYNTYKLRTGKNLDPTNFGFANLESLMIALDIFVKIIGKKKSIALTTIQEQLDQRVIQQRYNTEQAIESEDGTADENDVEQVHGSNNIRTNNMTPDVVVETNVAHPREGMSERQEYEYHQQSSPGIQGCLAKGSSRKLKLTSFVNCNTQTSQERSKSEMYKLETKTEEIQEKSIKVEEIQYSRETDEEIITIEESDAETESVDKKGTPKAGKKERKISRLAANFGTRSSKEI